MNRETCTAADVERMGRAIQRDPAAKAYGDHLRRKGLLGPVPLPAVAPVVEAQEAEQEVRRAIAQRFRL